MLQCGGNNEGQTRPSLPAAGCRWKSLPCSANTLKLSAASRVLTVCMFFFVFFSVCVCALSTLDQWPAFMWVCTCPRWHMRGHASSMCFGQRTCLCVCVCVGECAPACLPACRPACVRACVLAPGCGCVHELACQLMSPVIQQWACCGLVAGSRGWESHSRLQLSLAARKEGCRLSPAVSPPQPQGVIVAVGLCFGV